MTIRLLAIKRTRLALLASLAAVLCPATANADAISDLRDGSMLLWLDGQDFNGQDVQGRGEFTQAPSGTITTWKDKSLYNSAVGRTVNSSSYAKYLNGAVQFTGEFNGPFLAIDPAAIPAGTSALSVYTLVEKETGTITTATDAMFEMREAGGVSKAEGWASYQSNPTKLTVSGLTASTFWQDYRYSDSYINYAIGAQGTLFAFSVNSSSIRIQQDSTTVATAAGTIAPFNLGSGSFWLGGRTNTGARLRAAVSEFIVFSRVLKRAEHRLLMEAINGKHRIKSMPYSAEYGAPLHDRTYYETVSQTWAYAQYYSGIGGIGQEVDGSVTTGTSMGLTISNQGFLTNGAYFVAGVNHPLSSGSQGTLTNTSPPLPAGYTARSARAWYFDRTGGSSTGAVTLRFDLNSMGVSVAVGQKIGLLNYYIGYVTDKFGNKFWANQYTETLSATYDGSGIVEFNLVNPQDGVYMLGLGSAPPPAPNIVASLTSVSQSDGVSSSNFFNLPGSVLRQVATVSNKGNASPTAGSVSADFAVPANTKLRLADLGAAGSGPVLFAQGAPASGLSYTFSGLASTTDGLSFSNDNGATYTYTPVVDPADQTDARVTHFRVTLPGTFTTSAAAPYPSFTVTYDLKIK